LYHFFKLLSVSTCLGRIRCLCMCFIDDGRMGCKEWKVYSRRGRKGISNKE
jgi:hypothetical protein